MKRLSAAPKIIFALSLLLLVTSVAAILLLKSDFIAQRIRQAVVNGVEDATGARVEISHFEWNWRTLTVEMREFSMHGFESPSGPPLFTSPLIQARLRILSLLDQNVQLSSLIVTRPRFYLLVENDGKTNIPGPKRIISAREIVKTLINLRLPHVEARDGWAQINARSFPLSLVGDQVSLLIRFQPTLRRYRMVLRSPALRLQETDRLSYFDGSVDAEGELWRDHFALTPSRFRSPSADLTVSGSLYDFNQPVIDWHLASTLATTETLQKFGIKDVAGGFINLQGIGHHDAQTPLFFDGRISANHLSVAAPSAAQSGLRLHEASLNARLLLDHASVTLSELLVSSSEGRFSGSATLLAYRHLQLSGVLSGINLQSIASAASHQPFPWTASIGGPVSLSATLAPTLQNLESRGDLSFQPRSDGIPISGFVRYRYRQLNEMIVIEGSEINLPNTRIVVSGNPDSNLTYAVDTTSLTDLHPALPLLGFRMNQSATPLLARGGRAHLEGVAYLGKAVHLEGALDALRLQWKGVLVDHLRLQFTVAPDLLRVASVRLDSGFLDTTAKLQLPLRNWRPDFSAPWQASGFFNRARVQQILAFAQVASAQQILGGFAAGSFSLRGSLGQPVGDAQVSVTDLDFRGEHVESLKSTLNLANNRIAFSQGQLRSGLAAFAFEGAYSYRNQQFGAGSLTLALNSNAFPLSRLRTLVPFLSSFDARTALHLRTSLSFANGHPEPLALEGSVALHQIFYRGALLGDLDLTSSTEGRVLKTRLEGSIGQSRITGSGSVQIAPGTPASGNLSFAPVSLATVMAIFQPKQSATPLLSGSAAGSLDFSGSLEAPDRLHALLQLRDLQISGPPLRDLGADLISTTPLPRAGKETILQSTAPVTIELNDGLATVRSAEFTGRDTHFSLTGSVGVLGAQPLHLGLSGGIDLRLLQLIYPDLQIGGQSKLEATVSGFIPDPQLSGSVQLVAGSIASALVPNSLSDLTGTIRFDQHRATLENVTAHTGGGLVKFGGFVTYAANRPLVYRLDSAGQNIRVRYANGISITGNSQFSLTGTSEQSLLSGGITVSRIVLNPSADLGNLLALTAAPTVATDNSKDYLSRLQMDLHIESAPNLQLDTALSNNVQTELDLQLRGTPKQPVILGSIEANQGDIKVFGSRYTINRGQISFTNAARLEPVLDLDLQTQARGITVDITISGTLNKLNINYRSDPPLQPRDIIALLTVGRTPQTTSGAANVSSTNDANSLQSGANSVLGQAIAPVSNRLSKLFGITNIKIDPLVQGITNTPQARLTLEQQISRQITVTYITNLSQTSEQIFRLEYALNPQFSLIALRDDNGEFGIDILYKKRFK